MITMLDREPTVADLKPGTILRHFKFWLSTQDNMMANKYVYQVLCVAEHSETKEPMMVYQCLYAPFKIHCRPVSMVFEPVDTAKYPRATHQKHRFEIVGEVNGKLEL